MSENQELQQKPKKPQPLSRIMIKDQTAKIYSDAWEAKSRGEPIAWSTSLFPQEVCAALGVPVLYPESNCAALSARRYGEKFIGHAEGKLGFPSGICSYARINLGYVDTFGNEEFPADPAMPLPDFLLCVSNSCTQLRKWFEILSERLHIPLFYIDCLFNYYEEEPSEYKIKYVRSQIEKYIADLEKFLGRKLDPDKFLEVQKRGVHNTKLFNEIIRLNERKPSPLNGFDLFNYMSCMVFARCTEYTTEILHQLRSEIEEHIANNTSTFKGEEEYRIHWEGIACWPNLSFTLKTLNKYNVNAVINGYVVAFSVIYEPGNMDDMARAYQTCSTNSVTAAGLMQKRIKTMKDFGVDGMLCHINHSCKQLSFNIMAGRDMVTEELGVPIAFFDGDQADGRVFSEAQYETRVQSLVEIMRERKGAK